MLNPPDPIMGCPGTMVTVPMTVNCTPTACDAMLTIEGPVPPSSWSISGTGNCMAGSGSGTLNVTIPTSATPSSQSFGVLVKLNGKICAATTVSVTIDECVGLSLAGVADDKETAPGGFICLNDDDDNSNGVPDKDETGATLTENDLKALTVTIKPGLTGSVTLTVPAGGSMVKLYENANRSIPFLLPHTWSLPTTELPKTLFVEGFAVSNVAKDVSFKAAFSGPGGPCEDVVNMTVIDITLTALTFVSDHGLMADNNTDFGPTGTIFAEPEWGPTFSPIRNYPISHTMGLNVDVSLVINVKPTDAPSFDYRITGMTSNSGFNFDAMVPLKGGLNLPDLTSTDQLENKIQEIDSTIVWEFTREGCTYLAESTGPHKAYITVGTPRDTFTSAHVVTQKRMERAVQQASAANSLNSHVIVKTIIQAQVFDLAAGALEGQAWLVPDNGGDCQSIVRFAEKVAKMVDIPGTFEHRNIYAIETAPSIAIEDDPGDPVNCCGFNSNRRPHPANPAWVLSLVAGGLCNSFEATAKFTACGETRYYPAGTDKVYVTKDQVLYVFDTMSWVLESDLPGCTPAATPNVFSYTPKPPNATVPICP